MIYSQFQKHGIPPNDESFCTHFFARLAINAIRGTAATLLMPLDVLDSIRHSTLPTRTQAVSWGVSVAIYAVASLTVHTFRNVAETGLLSLFFMALMVVLAIFNGRLQTPVTSRFNPPANFMRRRGSFRRFGMKQPFGQSFRQPFSQASGQPSSVPAPFVNTPKNPKIEPPRLATEQSGVVPPPSTTSKTTQAICCRDCRNCHNDVCVRTGKPRRKSL